MTEKPITCDLVPFQTIKSGAINSCNFSDYNAIAIGTADKQVAVWTWTGTEFKETAYSPWVNHNYSVKTVMFSPDGQNIAASSSDGVTYIFNCKTGMKRAHIVQSLGGGLMESAFAPTTNHEICTVTDEGNLFVWMKGSYDNQRYWLAHESSINCMSFSLDAYLLATGDSDGIFKLWLVDHAFRRGFLMEEFGCHVERSAHDGTLLTINFSSFSFSTPGKKEYQICTGGDDCKLRVWSIVVHDLEQDHSTKPVVSVTLLRVFKGHTSSVTCVRYSPDGRYIGSTSLDHTARLWKVTGDCVLILKDHTLGVCSCAFSPDFTFFCTGSLDKRLRVWKILGKDLPKFVELPDCPEGDYDSVLQERSKLSVFTVINIGASVNSLDFDNNYNLAVGNSNRTVKMFTRVETCYEEKEGLPHAHEYSVYSVEYSRCGQILVSSSTDGTIIVWRISSDVMLSEPIHTTSNGGGGEVRFCPPSDTVGIAFDNNTQVFSIRGEPKMLSNNALEQSVNCIAFTPDGEFMATGCASGQLLMWSVNSHCLHHPLVTSSGPGRGITSCDFSQRFMKGTVSRVYHLAVGREDSLVRVYNVWVEGESMRVTDDVVTLNGHGGSVTQVRFSNTTANILASTSIDQTSRIWNVMSGECLNTLTEHRSQVTCCAFSHDSTLFATGSLDQTVVVWKVPQMFLWHQNFDNVEFEAEEVVDKFGFQTIMPVPEGVSSIEQMISQFRGRNVSVHIPDSLVCPITQQIMSDPFICAGQPIQREKCVSSIEQMVSQFRGRNVSVHIPDSLVCPITQQIMSDPVICADGFTYERSAILEWMRKGRQSSPMTNMPFSSLLVVDNNTIRAEIKAFLVNLWRAGHLCD